MKKNLYDQESFGEIFNKARLELKLSLEDISQKLKIRRSILEAIENGEVHKILHDIYAKGFVRNYAKLLGLNAERMVRLYMREGGRIKSEGIYSKERVETEIDKGNLDKLQEEEVSKSKIILIAVGCLVIIIVIFRLIGVLSRPKLMLTQPAFASAQEMGNISLDISTATINIQGETDFGNYIFVNGNRIETYGLNIFSFPYENIPMGDSEVKIQAKNELNNSAEIIIKLHRR